MRIALAYNLRTEDTEEQAELLNEEDVGLLEQALLTLGHEVVRVEVSGSPDEIVDRLMGAAPKLIFNVAEGTTRQGRAREAYYPAIYEQLGIPYTGAGPSLLHVELDKRLSEKLLSVRGIRVPAGAYIPKHRPELPAHLPFPLIIKPNYEGSSKGISKKSIVENAQEANALIAELIERYPHGLIAEQFIPGRELSVPFLEAFPGQLLEIVEHTFSEGEGDRAIFDYALKISGGKRGVVQVVCPPALTPAERQDVLTAADRAIQVVRCPDMGRVDIRLHEDGTPYLIELNPLPRLHPLASFMTGAAAKGLAFPDAIGLIVRSAARRYGLSLLPRIERPARVLEGGDGSRPTAREVGVVVGRLQPGRWNAITDVEGVEVGHVTQIRDGVPVPDGGAGDTTSVRTGVTAIVPERSEGIRPGELFNNHLVAGGFVLNGIGEMSGLTQAIEWGWLETPILLCNTMSVGLIHTGIIRHMIERYPELGRKVDVIIPLVGETNDAFLNDVRVLVSGPEEAMAAIAAARSGPVDQGSVGGGTGMMSFDFAGGIGSSSRLLAPEDGGYTVGVLVQSNFGKMRNLTVDGAVVGRELDPLYPMEGRRGRVDGSVLVIVATDAPLLSAQLSRLAKRAALGLGRVGSHAAATSGEIVFAFSTGNRTSRKAKEQSRILNLSFVTDEHINRIYEAVVEATHEAVLNSMFCSAGMTGREGRYAPPLPADMVLEILSRNKPPEEIEEVPAVEPPPPEAPR